MQNDDRLNPPELLSKQHDLTTFDCGVVPLNEYLKRYALNNQKKGMARTYVATRGSRVVGYYSMAYGSVSRDDAPPKVIAGVPKYPVPVVLLARLAVHKEEKGKKLGAGLLKDSLLRTVQAAEIAGLRAMLVHAKDDNAKSFYEHFGFMPSPVDAYQLFLTVDNIQANII